MPRVEASLDNHTKAAFGAVARRAGMTEAALLRRMIASLLKTNPLDSDGPGAASLRSMRLTVRVTPDIFEAVTRTARTTGASRPGIVLATLRARFANAPTLLPSEAEAVANAAYQLAMVGTNLNQLTRALHQGRTGALRELGPVLTEATTAIDGIRQQTRLLVETTTTRWAPQEGWQ